MRNYNFDLRRMLFEATLDRALQDIQRDTKRSLRNLLDLGLNFSVGRFPRYLLEALQAMLSDEQSAYFEAVRRTVQTVDAETLKTFSINVALESCTRGARKIRALEDSQGFNIPWALTICAGKGGICLSDNLRLVEEGVGLGIYVYLLLDTGLDQENLRLLASAYPKCAFVVLTDTLCAKPMEKLRELHNVMYLIDLDGELAEECFNNLQANRFLYGLYRWYQEENASLMTTDAALDAYRDINPVAVCFAPRQDVSAETRQEVSRRVAAVRKGEQFPYCPVELSCDLKAMDIMISQDDCTAAVCPSGQVFTARQGILQGESFNIHHSPLTDIFRRAIPKLQA